MTQLTIIPKYEAKFKGVVAAGEHVSVTIVGAADWKTQTLRLRALNHLGATVAQFMYDDSGSETVDWTVSDDGEDLVCEMSFDTVGALTSVPVAATVPLLFVLDDAANETLYFKGMCSVTHWPQRTGEDSPVDLGGYEDFVEDTEQRVSAVEAALASAVQSVNSALTEVNTAINTTMPAAVASAVAGQLSGKVDKETGKGLSENDFTDADKSKLDGLLEGAEENVQPDWAQSDSSADDYIKNKPTTLAGYGITDAKIENGRVVLGGNSLEPITEHQSLAHLATASDLANEVSARAQAVADESEARQLHDGQLDGRLDALEGSDAGKSVRRIAAEEVAGVVAGADASFDTLKEIADWIQNDTTGAAKMANDIAAATSALGTKRDVTDLAVYGTPPTGPGVGSLYATCNGVTVELEGDGERIWQNDQAGMDVLPNINGEVAPSGEYVLSVGDGFLGFDLTAEKPFADIAITANTRIANAFGVTQGAEVTVRIGCLSGTLAKTSDIPTVDTALSSSSTNPVQNKAIKGALDGKVDKAGDTMTGTLEAPAIEVTGDMLSANRTVYGRNYISKGNGSSSAYSIALPSASGNLALTSEIPAVDATLAVSGAAADAKATGDALALKADASALRYSLVTATSALTDRAVNVVNVTATLGEGVWTWSDNVERSDPTFVEGAWYCSDLPNAWENYGAGEDATVVEFYEELYDEETGDYIDSYTYIATLTYPVNSNVSAISMPPRTDATKVRDCLVRLTITLGAGVTEVPPITFTGGVFETDSGSMPTLVEGVNLLSFTETEPASGRFLVLHKELKEVS